MIHCPKCNYGWNPDTATICVQCKTPLASADSSRRSDTLNEDLISGDSSRRSTIAEGIPSGPPFGAGIAAPSAPPLPRWSDVAPVISAPNSAPNPAPAAPVSRGSGESNSGQAISADPSLRRRTVFAGVPAEAAASGSGLGAAPGSGSGSGSGRTPIASGSRRPQTVAVDPARKIVGVLITYSWQDSGQVFPVLEGRNLIGKDPDQCDICIPQDATLSAVNTFITYRRHFIIGDKVSMSGTDVDGEPIETEFVTLRNYAKIRTGSTYWTFVSIQPPSAEDAPTGA